VIRTFEQLSDDEKGQVYRFASTVSGQPPFSDSHSFCAKYSSEYYGDGSSYFTFWRDGRPVGAAGVISREVAERGEAFISGIYIPRDEASLLHRLVTETLIHLLPLSVRRVTLGISGDHKYLCGHLEELGFREAYTCRQLLHSGRQDLRHHGADLKLEPVTNSNAATFRRVHNAAFSRVPNGATLSESGVEQIMESENRAGLCCLRGSVLGIYDIRTRGETGWIENIAVDPQCQGRGHGLALLSHLVHLLYSEGCREVRLKVMSSNTRALRLYTGCGFAAEKVVSRWYQLEGGEASPSRAQ